MLAGLAILIFNLLCLILSAVFVFLMSRFGYYYMKNYGDSSVQDVLKWRILLLLLGLIAIGLFSSILNIVVSLITP